MSDEEIRQTQFARDLEEPAGRPIPEYTEALLFPAEAAYLLGLDIRTLEAYRLKGTGVPFVRLSARAIRYRRQDLLNFIESCRVTPPRAEQRQ